jgi:hypothetical protein
MQARDEGDHWRKNTGGNMTDSDFDYFCDGIGGVYEFYERPLSQFIIKTWWNALKQYDMEAVIEAFGKHTMNPDAGKWLPKPADIIRMLQGSTQDAAMVAWAKVNSAVRHKGTYVDVVFDDSLIHRVLHDMGGWMSLGTKTEDEWPFVAKEFENRYRGFRERSENPEYPKLLVGVTNTYNQSQGLPLDVFVMIGDEFACHEVLSGGTNKPLLGFKQTYRTVSDLKLVAKDGRQVREVPQEVSKVPSKEFSKEISK